MTLTSFTKKLILAATLFVSLASLTPASAQQRTAPTQEAPRPGVYFDPNKQPLPRKTSEAEVKIQSQWEKTVDKARSVNRENPKLVIILFAIIAGCLIIIVPNKGKVIKVVIVFAAVIGGIIYLVNHTEDPKAKFNPNTDKERAKMEEEREKNRETYRQIQQNVSGKPQK